MLGPRREDRPATRIKALSEAINGNFGLLDPEDGEGLGPAARRNWAADRLVERIEAEVESLRALRESLDAGSIEDDRAEAAERVLFDPSKEAVLARKYEAAAERGLFRTLREFREVEAQTQAVESDDRARGRLASCFPGLAGGDPEEDGSASGPPRSPETLPPAAGPDRRAGTPARGRARPEWFTETSLDLPGGRPHDGPAARGATTRTRPPPRRMDS